MHRQYGDDADKDEEDEEERAMPEFTKGETIPIIKTNSSSSSNKINTVTSAPTWASLDIRELRTTPPGYLTESELIGMMEKHGIGTDASIPTHIENIQKRNYVRLETGRRLLPNKLGLVLVQGYHQIDSGLVLPKVRSDIEGQCNRIAKGDMEKVRILLHLPYLLFLFFQPFFPSLILLSSFSPFNDV